MTAPTFAQSTRNGRVYVFPGADDTKYPSVTNVISQLAAPALEKWKRDQAIEAAIEHKKRWIDQDNETAREIIASLGRGGTRKAAQRGTDIHALLEGVGTPHPSQQGYLDAAASIDIPETVATEITFLNTVQGYAGTADVLIQPGPDSFGLLDWKTTQIGKNVGWRNHQLQLAALAACDVWVDTHGQRHTIDKPITDLHVVGLRPDGTADHKTLTHPVRIQRLQTAFNGLLEAWRLDRDHPYLTIWEDQK